MLLPLELQQVWLPWELPWSWLVLGSGLALLPTLDLVLISSAATELECFAWREFFFCPPSRVDHPMHPTNRLPHRW
jgi:hypothetical protein